MKKIRLNENDIENLVKKIIKEEGDMDWIDDVSESVHIYDYLLNEWGGQEYINDEISSAYHELEFDTETFETPEEEENSIKMISYYLMDGIITNYGDDGAETKFDISLVEEYYEELVEAFIPYIRNLISNGIRDYNPF